MKIGRSVVAIWTPIKHIRQGRLSTRQGTQGQSQGAPSSTPLNPHPSQVPPAASGENTSACGAPEPRSGHWSASTGGVRRRSPPDGRRGTQTLLGGEGRLNDTDGEEAKEKKERKRANCRGQRIRENLGGGGEGRRGGDQNHHRTVKVAN